MQTSQNKRGQHEVRMDTPGFAPNDRRLPPGGRPAIALASILLRVPMAIFVFAALVVAGQILIRA